ncbi:SGNH/GDSL hydrolase family protein [Planococcus shixiaomingii]|uniref:SGNH/GDSL hydrolase family protein n=1 Tax=Planococcus shixiaomingii TaxID=3058393 RepID=UPI002606E999|nr:GDSL-type esterase/lipase family protein [Planococcus sp. N022]WKA55677.1 GDSL-type esterase/lipase family protein [Planococcus sp. N022]
MKKKIAIVVAFFLFGAAGCGQEEPNLTVDYVALGDSLAAGQTPYAEIGPGYADMIAEELDEKEQLAAFTKELAVSGFTTDDVLEGLESEEASEIVESADIITISAGANDLLRLVQVNDTNGHVSFDENQVNEELDDVRKNMEAILTALKSEAPGAQVYVMGYYFPFPHLQDGQKEELAEQLDRLNEILKSVAEQQGAFFVPVDEAFGEGAIEKLPNADDIHPNREGYEAMAEAFFDTYKNQ